MKRILVVYASKQGHMETIVQHVARGLEDRGFATRLIDLLDHTNEAGADDCDATIVAGSVHRGRGEPSLTGFIMRHGPAIRSRPSAFLSISLLAASHCSDEKAALDEMAQHFLFDLGWQPDFVEQFAGAVLDKQLEILKSLEAERQPFNALSDAPSEAAAMPEEPVIETSADPLGDLMSSFSFDETPPAPQPAAPPAPGVGDVTDWDVVDRFVVHFTRHLSERAEADLVAEAAE